MSKPGWGTAPLIFCWTNWTLAVKVEIITGADETPPYSLMLLIEGGSSWGLPTGTFKGPYPKAAARINAFLRR
jgi:hypothetical protein